MSEPRDKVPASACRLAGGEVTFAKTENGKTPIRMLARSAEPIEHPWWGRIVHDMSGMKLSKKVLPADYEHWEPIGYLDQFDASDKGLFVSGELVETGQPNDRVAALLSLSRGGVPYEASINFGGDGIKIEWLGEDQVADVNGYTFEGPGVIVREWPLRGVAVCLYGADMHTQSKFARSDESFSISPIQELEMSKSNTKLSGAAATEAAPAAEVKTEPNVETKPAEATPAAETKPAETAAEPAPAAAATPAAPVAELSADRKECKRFVDSFGAVGGQWFAEGLSYELAQVRFTKQLRESNEELKKQNVELSKKLGTPPAGELSAVGFEAGDEKKKTGFAGKIRVQ